ncbi:MAG: hypothetical protein KDK70_18880 [Myxococcales bacterium]|nr:hypothetical protein [Myxococcales bacterium]
MSRRIATVPALLTPASTPAARQGATIGGVVEVAPDGTASVDFPGNEAGPIPARRIGVIDEATLRAAARDGRPVVLVFEDGDPRLPLILSVGAPHAGAPAVGLAVEAAVEPVAEGGAEPEVPPAVGLAAAEAAAEPTVEPVAEAAEPEEGAPPQELLIDGRRLVLRGTERIELRCGDASIVLRADGTLKIRGRDVSTLARRRQRIKGGSVSIN